MKVLIIDDHSLFREGLVLLLQPLLDDVPPSQAGSCEEALALVEAHGPADLALIDLVMPGIHGVDGIALLRERCPQMPVVALSSSDDRDSVLRAIDAGAMGFVPKSSTSAVLIAALKLILARGIYLPPTAFLSTPSHGAPIQAAAVPDEQASGRNPAELGLSARECEVLYHILQGKSAKVIERDLGLSKSTVKSHTTAVLRALNVTTRTQAVVAASKMGLRFNNQPV